MTFYCIQTVCTAMNSKSTYKQMLPEVHKAFRLYLTMPVTTLTSKRSFSTLKRLLTYLRATMTEKRLNNCMLLHIHMEITDDLNLVQVAQNFIDLTTNARNVSVVLLSELYYLPLYCLFTCCEFKIYYINAGTVCVCVGLSVCPSP